MQLPSTMKCIIYGRDRPLIQIRPTPIERNGHVLVRVEAVGLNPVDAKDVIGDKLPHTWTYMRSWLRSYIISNRIPGFDFAGTCVDNFQHLGDQKPFLYGDKVFGTMPPLQGTLAEYISVPLSQISPMPNNLKFEEAAALPLVGYVSYFFV
jgi:NADPH:quinone reductase-like Zn-dependent oxidoreductase